MEETKFSILIPVYGTEKYIRQCLDSVLNQHYDNFQIIAVDDGSLDNAGNICDKYSEKDQRITTIHQKNKGLVGARDTALRYMKDHNQKNNSVVMFLDSDDMLAPDALHALNRIFQEDKPDMVMFRWSQMDEDGRKIANPRMACYEGEITAPGELYKLVFSDSSYNSLCLKAIQSRQIPDQSYEAYYHLSHGEDLLRSISLFKNCHKVKFIKNEFYQYRMNMKSITHSVCYDNYKVDSTIRSLVLQFLEDEGVWSDTDFHEYFLDMGKMLRNEVCAIAGHVSSKSICYKIFDSIRADSYYQKILKEAAEKEWILKCLYQGRYYPIFYAAGIRKKLSDIKHGILKK